MYTENLVMKVEKKFWGLKKQRNNPGCAEST